MVKTYEPGRVVTVHRRYDERDRESGRVQRAEENPGYYPYVWLRFADGEEAKFYSVDLVPFGLDNVDRQPWAPGQAIILLDSYPDRGVDAGQLARVLTVSPTGNHLEARTKGHVPTNDAWLECVADLSEMLRRDRMPLPTYHEIIDDMRRGWHRGWIKADRCYRIPT